MSQDDDILNKEMNKLAEGIDKLLEAKSKEYKPKFINGLKTLNKIIENYLKKEKK